MRKPAFPGWFNPHLAPQKPWFVPQKTNVINAKRIDVVINDGDNLQDLIDSANLGDTPLRCISIDIDYGYHDESDKYYLAVGEEIRNPKYDEQLKKYNQDLADWEVRIQEWPEWVEKHNAWKTYTQTKEIEAKERALLQQLKEKYD